MRSLSMIKSFSPKVLSNVIKNQQNHFLIVFEVGIQSRSFSSVLLHSRKYNNAMAVTQPKVPTNLQQLSLQPLYDPYRPARRFLSSVDITKNLQLVSQTTRNVEKDPKTLKLNTPIDKPLVVILSWLQAKQKHLKKYAEIYTDQGFDVLITRITPWQLLWPVKGSQLVAGDLVKFLKNNTSFNPIIIHGFSVGGYLWGECCVHMARDIDGFKPVLERIVGQIWDSAADVTEIHKGVPKALFPRNPTLQNALKNYMVYHMKTFHETATSHYIRSSQMFHGNLCHAPALFLISKTDPVGAESSNQSVREDWEKNNVKITWKCWDRSPHVQHFRKHPEEYMQYLFQHLNSVNMLRNPEKLRAKL